ncbi:MAG TPA: hypothetical protein VN867_08435, partial [Candidatus Binataceae bacterium]|nr:hypothetical protein [Candidatus Binataceae bacterium]
MEWTAIAAVFAALIGMAFGWFVTQARAQSDAESKVRAADTQAQNERIRREAIEQQRADLQARCDDLNDHLRIAENGFAETRARAEETQKRFEE